METLAPPVVAVVVAHDPGPWFEETLASLRSQDYGEMSVLVLDAGDPVDADELTGRVAAVLPAAFVRHLDVNRGFGPTCDEVTSMVEGAAYYLFCHDDVALEPDAVHLLVEEAFRSNAGVVAPKVVSWDDPARLLHVGMTVDRSGSVGERVHPGEIDHGQHDAVRDIFVAPGGCTLVRADLFDELGGFDPAIVAMGEDLDFCWRAQVAGARIVVVPDARVRHREELASGSRVLAGTLVGPGPGGSPVTLQELQRRHELRVMLVCYSTTSLLRLLPRIVLLNAGELAVALLAGNRARARALWRAWSWNLRQVGAIRARRAAVRAHRRVSDRDIRTLQVGGSARLSTFLRQLVQHGFRAAGPDPVPAEAGGGGAAAVPGFGADDRRPGTGTPGPGPRRVPSRPQGRVGAGARLATWSVVAVVLLFGTRGLLVGPIPVVGQFVPFPSWGAVFGQFAAGWHPTAVGSTAPATPAFALIGVVGTVLLGAMGLTQKVLLFACLPLGAWGVGRLARPFGSARAALVAAVVYLALPLPYDALALGRLDALAVYAGTPWVLEHLFRATGIAPYARPDRVRAPGRLLHPTVRKVLLLGVLEAVLVSFVPAAAFVVVGSGLAVGVWSLPFGGIRPAFRALWLSLGATAVAVVLCLPWVVGVVAAGHSSLTVFGVATPPSGAPSWGDLLRFSSGPIGDSRLTWGFAVAALAPLLLARGERFSWAVRLWGLALVFWVAAWVVARGWIGGLAVDPLVLLGPAAVAVALAIGLGIVSFEEDLQASVFGWRQVVTVAAAVVVVLGAFPTVVSALPGRWDLPSNDFDQALSWMHGQAGRGAFRVLWLGDARALGVGSWGAGDGLAYTTSVDGTPDARWLWGPASPGPAGQLAAAVDLARAGGTDRLGTLLAPAGVRYVVVVTALAPVIPTVQSPTPYPVPGDLQPALTRQLDLAPTLTEAGITVYENTDWLPVRAAAPAGSPQAAAAASAAVPDVLATAPGTRIVPGAIPVLAGAAGARSYRGTVPRGTVLAALAPAGRWSLVSSRGTVSARRPSYGWAAQYRVTTPGEETLRFDGSPLAPLGVVFQVALWLLLAAVLLGRRRSHRPDPEPSGTGPDRPSGRRRRSGAAARRPGGERTAP